MESAGVINLRKFSCLSSLGYRRNFINRVPKRSRQDFPRLTVSPNEESRCSRQMKGPMEVERDERKGEHSKAIGTSRCGLSEVVLPAKSEMENF